MRVFGADMVEVLVWGGVGGIGGDVGGVLGLSGRGRAGNIGCARGGWYSGRLLLFFAVWLMGRVWLSSLLGQSVSNLVRGNSLS